MAALVRQARLIKWKIIIIKKSAREFTLGRHYSCLKLENDILVRVKSSDQSIFLSPVHAFHCDIHLN